MTPIPMKPIPASFIAVTDSPKSAAAATAFTTYPSDSIG